MSAVSIFSPPRFLRLVAADAMNIARDPMLIFATAMSLAPSLFLFAGQQALDDAAFHTFGLVGASSLVLPFVLVLPAFLIGWVTGFLLLEDRDEETLLAVDVTPVGKLGFLAYRVTVTALLTAAITLMVMLLLRPGLGAPMIALVTALIAVEAVASAVILPAIARNKVEGLALTKLTNIAAIAPLLALIPSPFRYVAGIVPSYWIGELLGLGESLPLVVAAALALVSHVACLALFFWLFQRRVG